MRLEQHLRLFRALQTSLPLFMIRVMRGREVLPRKQFISRKALSEESL